MGKITAIIQARMSSSRLPGKVMKEISGIPMLGWVVERTKRSNLLQEVIVATTISKVDDPIEDYCRKKDYVFFRGSEFDVLDRYYQAARKHHADIIVRLTADCPMIDAGLIDEVVNKFLETGVDFAANRLPPPYKRTYPIGLDVEVVSFLALERIWLEAKQPHEREHVMPYLYEKPGRFNVLILNYKKDLGHYRWTVDTAEDLEFVQQVMSYLNNKLDFSWLDILQVVEKHPELMEINAQVQHKSYDDMDKRMEGK
jgi:spore coat polysaccharide biosynthesis protein SpsF